MSAGLFDSFRHRREGVFPGLEKVHEALVIEGTHKVIERSSRVTVWLVLGYRGLICTNGRHLGLDLTERLLHACSCKAVQHVYGFHSNFPPTSSAPLTHSN